MKIFITTTLVTALLASSPLLARVGETKQLIDKRYGSGQKAGDRLTAPGVETWKYSRENLAIEVVLWNGVSIWEIFQRTDKLISNEDIQVLLEVYDSKENNWRFDRSESRWKRSGKPRLAAFRWPGHEDYFCIQDTEACEKAEKTAKLNPKGL